MDLLRHGGVVMKAAVDDGVGVGLGLVIRIVGDVGRRLALIGRSIGREGGARPTTM
jgi:nitrogen fixation/metabolism regulation signal transduction histidine kinase